MNYLYLTKLLLTFQLIYQLQNNGNRLTARKGLYCLGPEGLPEDRIAGWEEILHVGGRRLIPKGSGPSFTIYLLYTYPTDVAFGLLKLLEFRVLGAEIHASRPGGALPDPQFAYRIDELVLTNNRKQRDIGIVTAQPADWGGVMLIGGVDLRNRRRPI